MLPYTITTAKRIADEEWIPTMFSGELEEEQNRLKKLFYLYFTRWCW